MGISISKQQLLDIAGGKSCEEAREACSSVQKITAFGVEFDSRNIRGGELFVALPGEHGHGNQFVSRALEAGTALCLVGGDITSVSDVERIVIVPDSLKAFQTIASWWRDQLTRPILAITGSVGKTTVKEMVARILLETGPGMYSRKSFNNHVGVPYSLCQMGREHEWGILEMGMNHQGEMSQLSQMGRPDVATITNVAPAHIENLGSLENIAKAKLEILDGLKDGGTLVVNKDNSILMKELTEKKGSAFSVRTFGTSLECDVSIRSVESQILEGISFEIRLAGEWHPVKMRIPGRHNALNAAGAALSAWSLLPSLTPQQIIAGLAKFTAPLMRMQVHQLPDGRKIVDDSYNANLESMTALLALAKDAAESGLKVALVLGDMRELGSHSEAAHREMAQLATRFPTERCIGVGDYSKVLLEEGKRAGRKAFHVDDALAAVPLIRDEAFDILFVKASRGTGLDRVVAELLAPYQEREVTAESVAAEFLEQARREKFETKKGE